MTDDFADMIRASMHSYRDFSAAMDQLRAAFAGGDEALRKLVESMNRPDPYESLRLLLAVVRSGALRCEPLMPPDPQRDPRHVRPETIRRCAELTGALR